MSTFGNESGSFRALSRHEEYFINGGDLYFLVQHVLFRVHRYFFERESPVFQKRLAGSASPGAPKPGSSESNSIVLEYPSEDFSKFLWVFYNPRYSLYNTTVDDWKIILRLAFDWQFAEVKRLVVRELEKLEMNDVDRISTYHRYEIDRNLLMPRYAALCAREEPLTLQEGRDLGLETTLMIARARECARANPSSSGMRSPTAAGIQQDEMYFLVRQLFEIPSPTAESEGMANGIATPPGGSVQNQRPPSPRPSPSPLPPPPPPKPMVEPTVPVQPHTPAPKMPAQATMAQKTPASAPAPASTQATTAQATPPVGGKKAATTVQETPASAPASQATTTTQKAPTPEVKVQVPVENPGKKTGKGQTKGNKKGKQQHSTAPQTPLTATELTPPAPQALLSAPSLVEEAKEGAADSETPLLDSHSPLGTNGGGDDKLLKDTYMDGGFGNFLDASDAEEKGAETKDAVAVGSGKAGITDQVKDVDELVKTGGSDVLAGQQKPDEPEQTAVLDNGSDELEAAKAAVAVEP